MTKDELKEIKMKAVINNYFKIECSTNTSIREAFEKGFRIGVSKGQKKHCPNCGARMDGGENDEH